MRSAYSTPLGLLLAASLLAACAPVESRPAEQVSCPPPPAQALGERGMLRYQNCLGSLSPARLALELDAVRSHFARTGSGMDRVKLALLLTVPGTPFRSLPAARQMLGAAVPAAPNSGAPSSGPPTSGAPSPGAPNSGTPGTVGNVPAFAPVAKAGAVPADLAPLARLLETSLAQQQALEDRVQGLEKDLAAEKQRSDALQAQIDSIKNLERDMTRREPR